MHEHAVIRWKQRYANLMQAHALLSEGLSRGVGSLNQLEKVGLVQRFEFTFELAWKTLKDYLEEGGIPLTITTHAKSSRLPIQQTLLPMAHYG